ncbi:MAG: helix-turn-helix domain-containing protein, partial [Muribaculaceae bacterium]
HMHFLGKLKDGEERYLQIVHEKEWQRFLLISAIIVAILASIIVIVLWIGVAKEKRLNHELWLRNEEIIHGIGPKYQTSSLDEDSKSEIVNKILNVLNTDDAIYSFDFSINELASRVDMDYHYVSQVINESIGKSFYTLLSEYRIREACHRLDDKEEYGNYTIEGIANSVGFKSRSNFVSTFKRLTGLTPSEYRKQAMS